MKLVAFSVEGLTVAVGEALSKSSEYLAPENAGDFFASLGTLFPTDPANNSAVRGALTGVVSVANQVASATADLRELAEAEPSLSELAAPVAAVLTQVGNLVDSLSALGNVLVSQSSSLGLSTMQVQSLADKFPLEVIGDLTISSFETNYFDLINVLAFVGVLERSAVPADPDDNSRPFFVRRRIRSERLSLLLRDPAESLKDLYGLGGALFGDPSANPEVSGRLLLERLRDFSRAFGVAPAIQEANGTVGAMDSLATHVSIDRSTSPASVRAVLQVEFPEAFDVTVDLTPTWKGRAAVEQRWPFGLTLNIDHEGQVTAQVATGAFSSTATIEIVGTPASAPAFLLLGQTNGSRLEVEKVGAGFRLAFAANGIGSPEAFLRLEGGKVVMDFSGGDGFLTSLISGSRVEADVDLAAIYNFSDGLKFEAGGVLEIILPLHVSFGGLSVNGLTLRIPIGAEGREGLPIDFATNIGATFGPFDAVVDGIGLKTDLTFDGGNLGFGNIDVGFKAPTGVGLSLDGGTVQGGGFLSIDEPAGRYFGAVELSIFGIGVKAFGLVDTKLPGGKEGFSFVIVISAEFTPIQLGFGFTLIGVGGLLGVNRTLNAEGLSTAVRTGSLEHLLFPRNVVRDAPAIIHNLSTVFPAALGQYVFGPMGKLGWGTPTLVSLSIGIVLEFPGPRIALLGILRMALPTPDVALLELNMAVGGLLDFPKKEFSLDASLYDSQVVGNAVSGDMAYKMGFGDRPNFLMSIGGFNPAFPSPPPFPELRRAMISLGLNGNPSLTATGYFAITSNSVQAGASIELKASGAGIRLRGYLGFDVLFIFSPFSFAARIEAGVSVKFHGVGFGIHLRGELSGPTPWRIKGRVCVSILFWDACLAISIKFGPEEKKSLPEINPWLGTDSTVTDPALQVIGLMAAVSDPRNWSGSAVPSAFGVVSLTAASSAERVPIDPLGAATLRQKVAPLNRKLEKFGEYAPIVDDEFNLSKVTVDDQSVDSRMVRDDFAPAQFTELSDADRLSGPSYQKMDSGFSIAPDLIKLGSAQSLAMEYETALINDVGEIIRNQPAFVLTRRHILGMLRRSAAALQGIRRTGNERYTHPSRPKKVRVVDEGYVIANACTLKRDLSKTNGLAVTQSEALLVLRKHVAEVPADRRRFAVVPSYEAVA